MGSNDQGQLGLGDNTDKNVATRMSEISGVTSAVGGTNFLVLLMTDGTVRTTGRNDDTANRVEGPWYAGQLGLGDTTSRNEPVEVPGMSGVVSITAGSHHTILLRKDQTAWGFGENHFGQLGSVTVLGDDPQATPVQINVPEPWNSGSVITSISAGGGTTFLVLAGAGADGTWCSMGVNLYGEAGQGIQTTMIANDGYSLANRKILEMDCFESNTIASIVSGTRHSIFVMTDGTAMAVGGNSLGQLGLGDSGVGLEWWRRLVGDSGGTPGQQQQRQTRWSPVPIPGVAGVASAAAGHYHTVLVMSDGTVRTMGQNVYGQLGLGPVCTRPLGTLCCICSEIFFSP